MVIEFWLNGEKAFYKGSPSARLLDVLRHHYQLTGTKCGCMEGECGACSVIINGELRNSCLVAMGSLEAMSVLTIEGFNKTKRFTIISEAFASVGAVQCGFCTPGMILAAECLLNKNPHPTRAQIRDAISGNLCRCTGYNAIIKAVEIAADNLSAVNKNHYTQIALDYNYDEILQLLKNEDLIIYSGGTDLMVDEDCCDKNYIFIDKLSGFKRIYDDNNYIKFGAGCTFTQAIENPLTPEILRSICKQIAAPAIRNAGTLGGNIANGSAKADAALVFMVTDSLLQIVSADGRRTVAIKDFYKGGGIVDLKAGEIIEEIHMPKQGISEFYLKKVGARKSLAISRVSFAGIIDVQDGVITHLATAFGAVSDVILRFDEIDKMLIGKSINEARALRDDYLSAYEQAIIPRRGRVSVEYRKDVCVNLLNDFLVSNNI